MLRLWTSYRRPAFHPSPR